MWTSLTRLALLFAAVSVHGQDAAPRPDSMQSLKGILAKQNPVHWVQTPTSPEIPAQSTPVTASITDVTVNVDACTLSLKDGRVFPNERYESLQTWQFKIPAIDRVSVESLESFVERSRSAGRQPSWATKTTPTVFVLKIEALQNHKFAVHRWSKNSANEVIERDLQQPLAFLVFADEAGAREVEKSMQGAKAFCASKQQR